MLSFGPLKRDTYYVKSAYKTRKKKTALHTAYENLKTKRCTIKNGTVCRNKLLITQYLNGRLVFLGGCVLTSTPDVIDQVTGLSVRVSCILILRTIRAFDIGV